jgi:hypothetical protein
MIEINNTCFLAEVKHVADKTRFAESMFPCTIVQGKVNKGDIVQLLNANGDFIVEQQLMGISHSQRMVEAVQHGEAKDDFVLLILKHTWEYPIKTTKYIVKLSEAELPKYKREIKVELPIDNKKHYNELITKPVDIDEFVKRFYTYPATLVLGYYINDIHHSIGIECLRETELGALYSVHKVVQGGLLYIYYARIKYTGYVKVAGWYYVQKKLSISDFSAIKKQSARANASTLADVISIDPAARIYEDIYDYKNHLFTNFLRHVDTIHFLADGILKIRFKLMEGASLSSSLQVTKKTLVDFDDMQSVRPDLKIHPLNGRILPMDMIVDKSQGKFSCCYLASHERES